MKFLVIAKDYPGTCVKRMAVRPQHLANAQRLVQEGKLIYGIGLLDTQEQLIGSVMLFEADSRAEVDNLLANDIYITANIWEKIDVYPAMIGPFWKI